MAHSRANETLRVFQGVCVSFERADLLNKYSFLFVLNRCVFEEINI